MRRPGLGASDQERMERGLWRCREDIANMENASLKEATLLIVEDEVLLRKRLASHLERYGADVHGVGDLAGARRLVGEMGFDFVLLDVQLPDGKGTDLLANNVFSSNTAVVVMTAEGGVAGAVGAMQSGALDYLVKPFDPEELPLVFARAHRVLQSRRLEEHRRETQEREGHGFFFGSALAGLEGQINKILAADRRVESHLPPILIVGETGTGKTTVARWVHQHGPRNDQPMVEINCSALPETLAESELFGHERGAFTDARNARIGLFEAAHGGTLFLDELPSLSSPLQAKVLTAIEDHRVRRLGGNKEIPVDVRVIAATNRDLKAAVAEGSFREDLYHRLDLYRLHLPPLRERGEDIIELAQRFTTHLCQRHRVPIRPLSSRGRERLQAHPWPGNVRELAHELERAIVFEETPELEFTHLQGESAEESRSSTSSDPNEWFNPRFRFPASGFSLEEAIDRMIRHALAQTNQNVSAAARLLGVSRDYVRYRLEGRKESKSRHD